MPSVDTSSNPDLLHELIGVTRELLRVSQEQLRLAQRGEERFQRQQQAQRDEFHRWLDEHPHLSGRCGEAHEVIRNLLGRSMAELVEYVEENGENLLESDFVRTDMVDRYGSLLNHVSVMHGVLKRLAAADDETHLTDMPERTR